MTDGVEENVKLGVIVVVSLAVGVSDTVGVAVDVCVTLKVGVIVAVSLAVGVSDTVGV